jgi:hypothetical protein
MYMVNNNIDVGLIQETKLQPGHELPKLDGFSVLRRDRERDKGGGLAIIVSNNIRYEMLDAPQGPTPDDTTELQIIGIPTHAGNIQLVNMYIPPSSCCEPGYKPTIAHVLNLPSAIIAGDLNAHSTGWLSTGSNDTRGTSIETEVGQSKYVIINEDTATRVTAKASTSPDVTIVAASLANSTSWSASQALSSDHLPIIIDCCQPVEKVCSKNRHYLNYKRARWPQFRAEVETQTAMLQRPTSVHESAKLLTAVIKKAAARNIPNGRILIVRPAFPHKACQLANERDRIRATNQDEERVKQLSDEIGTEVNSYRREKWIERVEATKDGGDTSKLFKLIRSLTNPQSNEENFSIRFDGMQVSTPDAIARFFNRQFTPKPPQVDRLFRVAKRRMRNLRDDSHEFPGISSEDVRIALKRAKPSTAHGPDDISPIMLKHVGPVCRRYMADLFTLSIDTAQVPLLWRESIIIPLGKPGKEKTESASYRPISLLSPLAKLMERCLLPHLQRCLPAAAHQHGFRTAHSTVTALDTLTHAIVGGYNKNKPCQRTAVVALDLKQAFDRVKHGTLLNDLSTSSLPSCLKKWLNAYLSDRRSRVSFRGGLSSSRVCRMGVPQGGVLSPTLFNNYMSTMPAPQPPVFAVSYADDITIFSSGVKPNGVCQKLNEYLKILADWLSLRGLELSVGKCSATWMTTDTKEYAQQLPLQIHGKRIPMSRNPKILGLSYNQSLGFSPHTDVVKARMTARNRILKLLSGSEWGYEKETILSTYKAISRPIADYAAPVLAPLADPTHWRTLQIAQNAALRTATGCYRMTAIDHLHNECKMMKVQEHADMLAAQYWLRCHVPSHPRHATTEEAPPARQLKNTLRSKYGHLTDRYTGHEIDNADYRKALADLHTRCVAATLVNLQPNRVLGRPPPEVDISERLLPHDTRILLAQLRSGFCKHLRSFDRLLNEENPDDCPRCHMEEDTTEHLFYCLANPTELHVESLWTTPIAAAEHAMIALDRAG